MRKPFVHARTAVGLAAAVVAMLLAGAPAAAQPRASAVSSFDGTSIFTSFFPAPGMEAGERAPTVLLGHGWGNTGGRDPDGSSSPAWGFTGAGALRRAGYNVLTWDARGFGESGGTARLNSPFYEGRDVRALVDFLADQPEALLDAPGDPRVGMSGSSYGGGIQLVAAAIDRRIDAIAPSLAYNSLARSFMPEGAFKLGWGAILTGVWTPDEQMGDIHPTISRTYARAASTGDPGADNRRWFAARGPGGLARRIQAPTFLIQGKVDTVITASEAIRNHALLTDAGVPLKMMWFCGGHGKCLTAEGGGERVERATITWFDRHLKRDSSVDTGPAFEWIDEEGTWRSGPGYPLGRAGELHGRGEGTLTIDSTPSEAGTPWAAGPSELESVDVRIPAPSRAADVVGEPFLRIAYRGKASPARTFVFAQLVDERRGVVVDNQVTAIPVTLDGRTRTARQSLEGLASRTLPGGGYRLQILASSPVYSPQRSTGRVGLRADVSMPVVDPSRVAPRGERRCRPALRNRSRRWPARGERAILAVRLRLPCTGQALSRRVLISSAGQRYRTATGRATRIRIRRGQSHVWARFVYEGRVRSVAARLGS